MPMPAKGARLVLRERKGRESTWVIKDTGGFERSTGTGSLVEAERHLAEYIAAKNRRDEPAKPENITVAEILALYAEEHAPTVADPVRIANAIQALLPFWTHKTANDINAQACRNYAASRKKTVKGKGNVIIRYDPIAPATARRELNVLQAAINYCHAQRYITSAPQITLPATPETNQRALERDEVAKLLRACRARGRTYRHVAHFILVSIYTGTRKAAVLNLALSGPQRHSGWIDLRAGVLYRMGTAEVATKKRRSPARLPRQLLGHARRWHRAGDEWAVQGRGGRIAEILNPWETIVTDAALGWEPTPHTLKHTAITWAIRGGASVEDASAFFSTSIETITRVYWHLSPNFQNGAVSAIEGRFGR
jgi:integrase